MGLGAFFEHTFGGKSLLCQPAIRSFCSLGVSGAGWLRLDMVGDQLGSFGLLEGVFWCVWL